MVKDLTMLFTSLFIQRETTIVWDKVTGEPLYNAILWLDTRTQSTVEAILARLPRDANSANYLQGTNSNRIRNRPKNSTKVTITL